MSIWIEWVKQIKAISQIGKQFSKDPYDLERYDQLKDLAHEMFARLANMPKERVDHFFISDEGYATPKVDLRGGVFKDGKILLIQERVDGRWALPGGWADVCEPPSVGVVREVLEETGYQTEIIKLVAIKDRGLHPYKPIYPHHIYKLFFLCKLTGGEATENLEAAQVAFFDLDALPPLSGSRTLVEDIFLLRKHMKKPELSTYFD